MPTKMKIKTAKLVCKRPVRVSDVVTAVCLPIVVVLTVHASFLSRDLNAVSNSYITGSQARGTGTHLEATQPVINGSETSSSFDAKGRNSETKINLQFNEDALGSVGYPLNNTGRARQDLLIFTPILRSGSSSIRDLLKNLKKNNEFIIVSSPPKLVDNIHIPKKANQASNAATVSSLNQTSAVVGTFAFINFTEFGHQQPIQVSMVRDPLERAISWYYFMRNPYRLVENLQKFPDTKLPSRLYLRKSLESCLQSKNDPECLYEKNKLLYGNTVEYFCGHEHYCPLFGNKDGLQRAKEIVESHYAVVGVLEEWEKTVTVLEHYVPRFFKGASRRFKENENRGEVMLNKNMYKATVDQWARNLLKERLALEYDFYHFLQHRLNRQYEAIARHQI